MRLFHPRHGLIPGHLYIGKKALRDAVFASKFDGLRGPINGDPYGQCAAFKPSVLEFTSADPKIFGLPKIWPVNERPLVLVWDGTMAAGGPA